MAVLKFNSREIRARMSVASRAAIDETMDECVADAKLNHPEYPPASKPGERYANRSHDLTDSIRVMAHADRVKAAKGDRVIGTWGSDSRHALFLEIGTSREGPTATDREIAADGNMEAITPPIGPLMAPRPYLRPATDKYYPALGRRIARNLLA